MAEAKDTAVSEPSDITPANAPDSLNRPVLRGCLAVGVFAFIAGSSFFVHRLVENRDRIAANASPPQREPIAAEPQREPTVAAPRPQLLLPREPQPSLSLDEQINLAADAGVAYLRREHSVFNQYRSDLGLLGLTLLECGVSTQDPTVQRIADWLRQRANDLANTYELALAILFLDRLDDPNDRGILRAFGRRLMDGQTDGFTWTYTCPLPNRERSPAPVALPVRWPNTYPRSPVVVPRPTSYRGDNSNTQFALLGLWIAQRYGVAAREALLASEQYFRDTQLENGSWGYHWRPSTYCDSMTCAGLTSLAMRYGVSHRKGHGIRPEPLAQVSDTAILRGLRYLGRSLDKVQVVRGRLTGGEARDPLFFLWSLARIAVMYDLKKIGNREWYPWAAQMLVQTQRADGSWLAPYPNAVGTCFALLILKRSNFTSDLRLTVLQPTATHRPGLGEPNILHGRDAIFGSTVEQSRHK